MNKSLKYKLESEYKHYHLYYEQDEVREYLSAVIQLLPDNDWKVHVIGEDGYYIGSIYSERLGVAIYLLFTNLILRRRNFVTTNIEKIAKLMNDSFPDHLRSYMLRKHNIEVRITYGLSEGEGVLFTAKEDGEDFTPAQRTEIIAFADGYLAAMRQVE